MRLYSNILRWLFSVVVLAVALLTYTLTREPTVSLWDCGEFISASYKLQVVHPPGAPFFLMLNRLFTLLASSADQVPLWTNFQSALFSALTIFLLYWITLFLLDRLGRSLDEWAKILGAALAALLFTFTDTIWFSAVETEVYALSTFLMALSFWVMLWWARHRQDRGNLRYLVFLGYLMGISVGVHLLSLVVLPIVGLVYYFSLPDEDFSWKRFVKVMAVAVLAFVVVYVGNLRWLPWMASRADLIAVNQFGMPYWSGVLIFLGMWIGSWVGIAWYFHHRKHRPVWRVLVWSYLMSLLGVTSYAMVVIRSMADPPIDMNSPEDIFSLRAYLNREQYGDRPLLRGPSYTARSLGYVQGEPRYVPLDGRYVQVGYKWEPRYRSTDLMWFPRLGDRRNDRIGAYRKWLGIEVPQSPSWVDNIRFFFIYQLGHMGWRYHAWNFVGRQNDLGGRGEPHRGNWITGINLLDRARVGDYRLWPSWMKANRAYNPLLGFPFLLALLGMWYQYQRDRVGFWYVFAFFFMTGIALIIYLNNPPNEPRERDYTLVGAFYGFAMWLGFGAQYLFELLRRYLRNVHVSRLILAGVTIALPWWTASHEWDDHDRSGRYLVRDLAYNILMSCDSNAILIVNGDNSTYPVWYLQEVEGIRTDVRVVNYQLLSSSWYVLRLKKDAHGGDAIRFTFPEETLRKEEYVSAVYRPVRGGDRPMDIRRVIQMMASDDPRTKLRGMDGKMIPFYPTRRFFLPVDKQAAIRSGLIRPHELGYAVDTVYFSIGHRQLPPNALMMLDIIASNLWERPISVVIFSGHVLMGLQNYVRQRGLVFTITPVPDRQGDPYPGWVDLEDGYRLLAQGFRWGKVGIDSSIWYDEVLRRHIQRLQSVYLRTAIAYLKEKKTREFRELAHIVLDRRLPYMQPSLSLVSWVEGLYDVGDTVYARKVALSAIRSFKENVRYFESLPEKRQSWAKQDLDESRNALRIFRQIAEQKQDTVLKKAIQDAIP